MNLAHTNEDARKVVYSMTVSLDGFVNGPNREIDWHIVDEEVHTFVDGQQRDVGTYLFGRRMYEVMSFWDTVDIQSEVPGHVREFARSWKDTEKIVFSRTLEAVPPGYRLGGDDIVQEVDRLRSEPGGDIAVAGPGLAASVISRGLIDEYRLFVNPVILGSGTPFFPELNHKIRLRLVESRSFRSGVMYLCYRNASDD